MFPMLSMFGVGMMRVMQKVSVCYSNIMQLANYLPAVNVAVDLMRDVPSANAKAERTKLAEFKKGIYFKKVAFAYPQAPDQKVLDDVTLRIECNKFVAVVGPSGGGKSTIVDLLLNLYRPTHGEILIDDQGALEEIDIDDWRGRIGLVSQDTFLFNGSAKENIAFATSEIDTDRVERASKIANAHHFIEKLPDGYETEIGERGLKLSGGERQRLAIARALYRNPEIILLDEATSSLDTHSEREVQMAIENLKGTRTLIVIAHRLSTIIRADWIYVINGGRIVEEGTHNSLLQKKGLYYDLCREQDLHVDNNEY